MARQVLKVAVVGEEGTGRSCIIARYVEGLFLRTTKPTTGADFSATHVTVSEQDYLYQIWDVSGKWRTLPSLGSEFWMDMSGCILVYDVTSAASFRFLDELRGKVYRESSCEDIPLILVGNKADLEQGREVSTGQAQAWCEDKSIPFFETSAKSDAGLHVAFQLMAEHAVEFYKHRIDVQTSQDGYAHQPHHHPLLTKVSKLFKLGRSNSKMSKLKSNKQASGHGPGAPADGSREPVQEQPKESPNKSNAQEGRKITLQQQLEEEQKRSQELLQKVEEQEKDILEKAQLLESHEALLKAMHNELEQKAQAVKELTQTLKEVTARCQAAEGNTRTFQDQMKSQSPEHLSQQQQLHATPFWEVERQEVELNMHRMVGTGAWGYVVEGKFRGKTVAVKCLHSIIRQSHFLQTIRREIDIMARVRHPNLVLFIAVVLDNETGPMIITELLNTSLRHAYEQNQLHKSSVLSILVDVALALNYLHLLGDGIIHRDVSSANVLLEAKPDHQWKAKLSDFGSANLVRESSTVGPGTIVYSAPEVRRECSIPQTPKVDVFSYGVLVCEVLLCRFTSSEHFQLMLEEVRRWPLLYSVACGCTQESPEDRPTMSAVICTLNQMSSIQ